MPALLTVQNTQALARVEVLAPDLLCQQLDAVLQDVPVAAAKTGALGSSDNVRIVARRLARTRIPLVVDPVLTSTLGVPLSGSGVRRAMIEALLPCASLVTPNLKEAESLTGLSVRTTAQARDAARALVDCGAQAALVTGGHLEGAPVDVLLAGGHFHELVGRRIATRHAHGAGCTLSAAIAARLARAEPMVEAVQRAKEWLTRALATARGFGGGASGLNHLEPLIKTSER